MYYQVGNKCLEASQAENLYFSLVVPQVMPDGRLIKPEYNGSSWSFNGQLITSSLPSCDPTDNLKNGMESGWLLFGVAAALYVFVVLKKVFR